MFYYADQIGCFKSEEVFKEFKKRTIANINNLDWFEPDEYREESLKTLLRKLNITFSNYKSLKEIKQNLGINILKKDLEFYEEIQILEYVFKNCIRYDYTIYNCCYKIDKIKSDMFLKYRCCKLIKDSYQFKELDTILNIYIKNFEEVEGKK